MAMIRWNSLDLFFSHFFLSLLSFPNTTGELVFEWFSLIFFLFFLIIECQYNIECNKTYDCLFNYPMWIFSFELAVKEGISTLLFFFFFSLFFVFFHFYQWLLSTVVSVLCNLQHLRCSYGCENKKKKCNRMMTFWEEKFYTKVSLIGFRYYRSCGQIFVLKSRILFFNWMLMMSPLK